MNQDSTEQYAYIHVGNIGNIHVGIVFRNFLAFAYADLCKNFM